MEGAIVKLLPASSFQYNFQQFHHLLNIFYHLSLLASVETQQAYVRQNVLDLGH